MKRNLTLLVLLISFLFSCKNEPTYVKPKTIQEQWLQPIYWLNEYNELHNFPFWFNEHLVQQHHIPAITLREYYVDFTDSIALDTTGKIPDRIIRFEFDSSGTIISMNQQRFQDLRLIAEHTFHYSNRADSLIYKTIESSQLINFENQSKQFKENYEVTFDSPYYTQFKAASKSIYYIKDTSVLNPISVDTMLNPQGSDMIVYPNFKQPQKIYSVKNVIIESPITMVYYDKKQHLDSIITRIKSNTLKKIFQYNSNGYLNEVSEQVLEVNRPIRTLRTKIQLDAENRPVLLYQESTNTLMRKGVIIEYH